MWKTEKAELMVGEYRNRKGSRNSIKPRLFVMIKVVGVAFWYLLLNIFVISGALFVANKTFVVMFPKIVQ